jgi:membrane protein implicated in regulation of membrane protease activity
MVRLQGERWAAYAEEPVSKGDRVVVESISGLTLTVKKLIAKPRGSASRISRH